MKTYHDQDIWTDEQADGTINIGFRQEFINSKLMECFHVIPGDVQSITKDGPMLVIETNCELESIKAPITGHVQYFNPKARNFPDRLKEEDVIITLGPNKKVPKVDVFDPNEWDEIDQIFNQPVAPRR